MENPFEQLNNKIDNIKQLIESQLFSSINTSEINSLLRYTKKEAANELSCSVAMIDKLLQQGRLEKIKVGAKVLIPKESIDLILNRHSKNIKRNETYIINSETKAPCVFDSGIYKIDTVFKCGIYFLYKHTELIYIGRSENILMRIGIHVKEQRIPFDSFKVIPLDYKKLKDYECAFIRVLRPIFNGNFHGNYSEYEYKLVKPYLTDFNK